MATFDEFYASLDPDVGVRGKQFEKFIKWFLKTDPTWSSQIDEVWLWNDYPKRWGADCGIDLIFTHKNGKTWAVQSKCVSPNNDIKKSEIDSFLSESSDSKIDGRLLIASTDGIGKNAQQVIHRQEKQVVCFLLEQFRQSEIEFPSSMEELNQGKRKEKKSPRPHQIEAIEKVSQGLKTADRGQVLMACGTGKTLTSLWIKEKIKAEQVLVLVPSLNLLSQTLKEWNAEANESFKWICICSDKSVAKDKSEDQWISNTSEIGVPVTSDTLEVKHFLDESGSKVVFATYQSSQLIVEAQEHHDTSDFDLVIADEAHRCVGRVSDAFGSVLDENKIKASKRIFLTATPKVISSRVKKYAYESQFMISSMDDEDLFGKILYKLKFSEAIKLKLLSEYQLVVIGVDDDSIKKQISSRQLITVDGENILDAEKYASFVALVKAIRNYDLKNIITFHSRIRDAKEFSDNFESITKNLTDSSKDYEEIICDHVSGNMSMSLRNKRINSLKTINHNQRKILTNARCLSEGVDIPSLSGVAFIDPKYSQVDIIQAIGRAIRKSEDKSVGTIIIPIYLSNINDLKDEILEGKFKDVWRIILALKSQDDILSDEIDQLRVKLEEKKGKSYIKSLNKNFEKIKFDIPLKISKKFTQSLNTILIRNTSDNWDSHFEQYKKHILKNQYEPLKPHPLLKWINDQKINYEKGLLQREKINLLNQYNFVWTKIPHKWQVNFHQYRQYLKSNKNEPELSDPLYKWIATQRQLYGKGQLSYDEITLLKSIGFKWTLITPEWLNTFDELRSFILENQYHPPSSHNLFKWMEIQRREYDNKTLSLEKIDLLNRANFQWKKLPERKQNWEDSYHNYRLNVIDDPSKYMKWERDQRNKKSANKLSINQIRLLNRINFSWKISESNGKKEKYMRLKKKDIKLSLEEIWNKNFDQLREKIQIQGWSVYLRRCDLEDYKWLKKQRKDCKNGNLSQEKINKLNTINFVWNDKLYFEKFKWDDEFEIIEAAVNPNNWAIFLRNCTPNKYAWIKKQRNDYKKGILSQEKINKLNSINFVWDEKLYFREIDWYENFNNLKELVKDKEIQLIKTRRGLMDLIKDPKCTRTLGIIKLRNWTVLQQVLYKKGNLDNKKQDLLMEINEWFWNN